MHRRRTLLHRPRERLRERPLRLRPTHRRESGDSVSDRARLRAGDGCGRDGGEGGGDVRCGRALRHRSEYGEASRLRSGMVRGGYVHPDVWRFRLRRRIRHRTQIPRDAALSGGADLDQPHPLPCRDPCSGSSEVLLMMDIDRLRGWIGSTEIIQDIAAAAPLTGLAALLDRETPPWAAGEVPPLGHWLYFLPRARQSDIDVDGHPRRGGFLPPIDLPRRMFAGATIAFHAPIAIGAKIERVSTILDVTEKTGTSGHLVFVKLRHEVASNGTLAVTEEQDIVYREAAAAPSSPSPKPDGAPRMAGSVRRIVPDPT